MKYQQILQDIQLLANHRSIQSLEKISTFQYRFIFLLKDSSSIYANIRWVMTFHMPQNYPYSPPKLKFETPIFHLNVANDGTVCIAILKEDWTEMSSPYSVIDEIQNILEYPDTTHPADSQILHMFTNNKILYNEKCAKHLQFKPYQTSRIQSDAKQQLQQQISDLNRMKLTNFSGIQDDMKFTLSSNLKTQQMKFETQISNIFGKPNQPNFQEFYQDSKHEKIIKITTPKTNNNSYISKQTSIQSNHQDIRRNMFLFDKEGNSQKPLKKKILKQSNLLSIAESIKGEDNSNIFDLSASKDQKCTINMKFSKTLGIRQSQGIGRERLMQEGKRQNDQRGGKHDFAQNQLSTVFQKQIRYLKSQKMEGSTFLKNQLKRPDIVYETIANRQSDEITKLMHKVSQQLWKSIESIAEIQKNLKSQCVGKSKALEKVLKVKMQNELENLQRLQHLERQLKQKMIDNLQKGMRISVK